MHRNGRYSIVCYWRFGDEKTTRGGSVCRRSAFDRPSFDSEIFNFFATWKQKLGSGYIR